MARECYMLLWRARRRRVLLSLWRLLADKNAPDPGQGSTNRAIEPEFAQRLPTLGKRIDPLECLAVLRAQCAEIEQLHVALQALDVAIPGEMPVQVRIWHVWRRPCCGAADQLPDALCTANNSTAGAAMVNWRSISAKAYASRDKTV